MSRGRAGGKGSTPGYPPLASHGTPAQSAGRDKTGAFEP
jgi:hypothetical protein